MADSNLQFPWSLHSVKACKTRLVSHFLRATLVPKRLRFSVICYNINARLVQVKYSVGRLQEKAGWKRCFRYISRLCHRRAHVACARTAKIVAQTEISHVMKSLSIRWLCSLRWIITRYIYYGPEANNTLALRLTQQSSGMLFFNCDSKPKPKFETSIWKPNPVLKPHFGAITLISNPNSGFKPYFGTYLKPWKM